MLSFPFIQSWFPLLHGERKRVQKAGIYDDKGKGKKKFPADEACEMDHRKAMPNKIRRFRLSARFCHYFWCTPNKDTLIKREKNLKHAFKGWTAATNLYQIQILIRSMAMATMKNSSIVNTLEMTFVTNFNIVKQAYCTLFLKCFIFIYINPLYHIQCIHCAFSPCIIHKAVSTFCLK